MKVRLSRDARDDLREITNYLTANASKRLAGRVAAGLRAAARDIGDFPEANIIIASHLGASLRRRPFMRWALLYQVLNGEIVVVRIADSAQDYFAWFTP